MIIVQLKGGFGNQLFQYAAGLSLASVHNTPLKVDVSELNQPDKQIGTFRAFELQQIILEPLIADENEIRQMQPLGLHKFIDKLRPPYKRSVYKEQDFSFDLNFFKAGDNIYLKGYRQSEKYFKNIEEKIRYGFQLKPALIRSLEEKGRQLSSISSVSIHIRRGDYANPIVKEYHGILEASYYQNAIAVLELKVPDCRFFVFSDDSEWVNKNLRFSSPFEMISGIQTTSAIEDFYLISQCKHQVIANSTFSWWAAWLNPNPGKIVIAPKKWFNNAPYDTRDLIPESWIKL